MGQELLKGGEKDAGGEIQKPSKMWANRRGAREKEANPSCADREKKKMSPPQLSKGEKG